MVVGSIILGITSGLLSFSSFLFGEFFLIFFPGLVFSIALLIFLRLNKLIGFSPYKILWVIISALGYFAAVCTAIAFGGGFGDPLVKVEGFMLAGAVGALIMFLNFKYLVFPIKITHVIFLVLLGGILGLVYGTFGYLPSDHFLYGYDSLFILWQTGMAVGLIHLIKKY